MAVSHRVLPALGALALLAVTAPRATAGEPQVGGAAALPYDQAVARSRTAASAVLHRAGAESCLRGKLTNALLGLSASCDAEGLHNPLCSLANQAVVSSDWRLPFMDATARSLLDQS
jgi:hypothetical protein